MPGTTPTYGIPYPTPTDRVADGADAIRATAEAVDSALAGAVPAVNNARDAAVATITTNRDSANASIDSNEAAAIAAVQQAAGPAGAEGRLAALLRPGPVPGIRKAGLFTVPISTASPITTAPANTKRIVKTVTLGTAGPSAAASHVSLTIPNVANIAHPGLPVDKGIGTLQLDLGLVLKPGESLAAVADVASVAYASCTYVDVPSTTELDRLWQGTNGAAAGTWTTVYTAPADRGVMLTSVLFGHNTTTHAAVDWVGVRVGTTDQFRPLTGTLPARTLLQVDAPFYIAPGEVVQVFTTSANIVTSSGHGYLIPAA